MPKVVLTPRSSWGEVRRIALPIVLPVLLLALIAGCGLGLPGGNSSGSLFSLGGSNAAGKILVVKDGGIWKWQSGNFKALFTGNRYASSAWSPSGQRLVAAIVGGNHSDLIVLNESGGQLSQLTDNWSSSDVQDCAWARSPAWSPDGQKIAFVSDMRGLHTDLWLADADDGSGKRVIEKPGVVGDVDYPNWSPDGQKLVVTGFDGSVGQVYVVTIASGQWAKLTDAAEGALQPAWSPDGKKITFVMNNAGGSDIWVMNADGSDQVAITADGTANSPTWSPDGKKIAYLAGKPSADLYVISANPATPPRKGDQLTNGAKIEATSRLSWAN